MKFQLFLRKFHSKQPIKVFSPYSNTLETLVYYTNAAGNEASKNLQIKK